ncbi:hypothetical protein BD413DRAFT_671700 [Trametes elegans]|nr:hypothetical protein BD413DRAFT_671700 [Trametes elegans]
MSSDQNSVFSHFSPLDELIQVIYQGSSRFVIISSVDDDSWTVHVGLTGEEGRWWQGRWTEKDVRAVLGSNVAGSVLDSFVENMENRLLKEEVSIASWTPGTRAAIQLVFGEQANKPISVALQELASQQAAAYATKVFTEIALQAKPRKCRLYPSLSVSGTAIPALAVHTPPQDVKKDTPRKDKGKERASDEKPVSQSRHKRKAEEAEEEIQALRAELEKTKREQSALTTAPTKLQTKNKQAPSTTTTRTKANGMSLANPSKRARKYQPIEFESDDE